MRWLWDRKASMTRTRVQQRDVRAKKSMGQNYLVSEGTLEAIVRTAGVVPGDCVIEVGPGTGNLTKHLLLAGARVLAVEKDEALAEKLLEEFQGQGLSLEVVTCDVLTADVPALATRLRKSAVAAAAAAAVQAEESGAGASSSGAAAPRVKVVANLPFYITKDCLRTMLPLGGDISHLFFLLQDEVAVRLARSGPGDANYRAMSVETRYYSRPRYAFQIDRKGFFPPPKCNGALAEFELLPPGERPLAGTPGDERPFLRFVASAFSQRRKMLHNSLSPRHAPDEVVAALERLGLAPSARAQDLALGQYVSLYRLLQGARIGGASGGSSGGQGGGQDGKEAAGSEGESAGLGQQQRRDGREGGDGGRKKQRQQRRAREQQASSR